MRWLVALVGWLSASVSAVAVCAGVVVLVRTLHLAAGDDVPDERFLRAGDLVRSPEARSEEERLLRRRARRILAIWVISFVIAWAAYVYVQPGS